MFESDYIANIWRTNTLIRCWVDGQRIRRLSYGTAGKEKVSLVLLPQLRYCPRFFSWRWEITFSIDDKGEGSGVLLPEALDIPECRLDTHKSPVEQSESIVSFGVSGKRLSFF